jgi:hypothetical protein
MLALVAGVIFLAVLVGAGGGAINGRLKGEIALGAIVVGGAYFLAVVCLESRSSGKIAVFGLLPLILTFIVGSSTTQLLETRLGLRPTFAVPAAFGSALLVGFSYLMLIRLGWLALADPSTAWIALAVLSCLIVWSIWKRLRATR